MMTRHEFALRLAEHMNADGLLISPNEIKFEDRFCRCGIKYKPNGKDGSYRTFKHGKIYCAWWRNWSTATDGKFSSVNPEDMTPKVKEAYEQALNAYSEDLAEENDRRLEIALKQAPKFWSRGEDLHEKQHGYLRKKQVRSYGLRLSTSGKLMIPAYNQDGNLQNIQRIFKSGDKYEKYYYPWPTRGTYFPIPASKKLFSHCF